MGLTASLEGIDHSSDLEHFERSVNDLALKCLNSYSVHAHMHDYKL